MSNQKQKVSLKDYNTSQKPTWCPGCGDFGIWAAIKNALIELDIEPKDVVISYDIGCIGNMASTIKCYGFHSLHGRVLPVALGAKLANPKLTVLAIAGDGGAYGEGTNHLIHTARFNADINYIVGNNRSFSLTTGQSSPTSDFGYTSKTTPYGEIKTPVNPLTLSLVAGATFVARGAAFEIQHLTNLIKQAIKHPGFSHIDVLQPCVTFNKVNSLKWYQQKIYKLENSYKPNDLETALKKATQTEKLPVGLFYQSKHKTYAEQLDISPQTVAVDQQIKYVRQDLLQEFE